MLTSAIGYVHMIGVVAGPLRTIRSSIALDRDLILGNNWDLLRQ
jgi:hypothetical protein